MFWMFSNFKKEYTFPSQWHTCLRPCYMAVKIFHKPST
jgi:hypothetical protein